MEVTPFKVLVLNASLKHGSEPSNTEEVTGIVISELEKHVPITAHTIRLADKNIPVGLSYRMTEDDEWPSIADEMKQSDIVIFATPIWWGGRSSLIQRVIERMDAFDEDVLAGGRAVLLNKVAGIVITGSEDGAQAVMASLMSTLSFLNFTLPPNCCTYWVGETGLDPKTDAERRRKNPAVQHMATQTGKSIAHYATLLREHPLV